MSRFHSRTFSGSSDLPLLIDFARAAMNGRTPLPAYWHPGDVVWQFYQYGESGHEDVRLWFDDEGLAAFGYFEDSVVLRYELRPDLPEGDLAPDVIAWAEERRRALGAISLGRAYAMLGDSAFAISVFDSHQERREVVAGLGHVAADRSSWSFRRNLAATLPPPTLPDGFRLRGATDDDIESRTDLHRDAWSVWGPSSFTTDAYRRLRASPLYRPELDVVLEDSGGRLLSYCVCWADEETGTGHFEPVGTRPSATGRGYGKAVIMEGLRRHQEMGMHSAIVETASVNEGARGLYESCGFEIVDRDRFFVKEVI